MKNFKTLGIIIAALVVLQSCQTTGMGSAKMDDKNDTASYYIGVSLGHNIVAQKAPDLDVELIVKGIREVMAGDSTLSMMEANMFLQGYFREIQMQLAEVKSEEGRKFLEENKTLEGVIETASGLQYKVIEEGTGLMPKATDQVKCHYRGRTLDGKEFDSSYKRGQPATFGLNGVIPGWTEGLQLMKEGGKYELYIPGELAYGPRGQGQNIGPNETLIFEIELLEIVTE